MNEPEDPEIARWKRARSVIEHENTLVNNRVTWLLASQGFLIASYAALLTNWGKPELKLGPGNLVTLVVVLFIVSFYICLSIGIMLAAAIRQIKYTHCWWYGVSVTANPKEIE